MSTKSAPSFIAFYQIITEKIEMAENIFLALKNTERC